MHFAEAFAHVANLANPQAVQNFQRHIPFEWIEQAIAASEGTATMRRRRLPACQVVWLVLGMALFRDRSIVDIVNKLDLALPDPRFATVAPSAVALARARVGYEPLARLFDRCAQAWAHASADRHRWRGLAVYGIDGSTLRVPDSAENRAFFGEQSTGARGTSAYPLVRVVALMALRSHLLADVRFGPYATGEVTYAKDLWAEIPDHSLTIEDRGFFGAGALIPLAEQGVERHWLTRARADIVYKVVEKYAAGDELIELNVSSIARRRDPDLPKTWRMRAIRYQRRGFQPQLLLTSLLDATKYPAAEVTALYHERWELELGYDEIKTELLDREESIRSRSPAGVGQELWGIFLAYNLVRLEMERIAEEAGVEPVRISFVAALRLITDEWLWCAIASPGAIPRHLQNLRKAVKLYILPARRSERAYPRAVKLKMTNYPRNRSKNRVLQPN